MRIPTIAAVGLGLVLASTLAGGQEPPEASSEEPKAGPELKTLAQKVSYTVGLNLGTTMKGQGLDFDPAIVAQGIKDGLAGKPRLTSAQIQEAMETFRQELIARKIKEGDDFLAANKRKTGVVTLPSGLQYNIVREGTGRTPRATDTVSVNYEGKLIDGVVFDSSARTGKPVSIPLSRVIKGWSEALQMMKEGAKWHLVIPPNLGYGASPPPGAPIPPNAVLVFDVDLLRIEQPGTATLPGR